MKNIKENSQKDEEAFAVLDQLQEVKVSPFFKDTTMQRLFAKKEEAKVTGFSWFSPKIQLATFICVLIINILGVMQLSKIAYKNNVSQFAETYELSQENRSFFN